MESPEASMRARRTNVGRLTAVVVGVSLGLTACDRSESTAPYPLVVRVEARPDRPVAGAKLSFSGRTVGTTNERGTLTLHLRGSEGEHVPIGVTCPDDFLSPAQPIDVVLHRLDEPGRKPEYDVQCRPVNRSVVIVVRADRGEHLPVLYLGKEVARTDESGAAHALLEVPDNEEVEITLGTTEPGNERLRPQNPSIKFAGADLEEIKIFSVQFQLEPEVRRASAPARRMPVRIN
jgi:hypothetical protein